MWHEADAQKSSLIAAAMNSYRHELLIENFVGTPIMQGHGQLDDNVPTFHSRRMALLASEAGWDTQYAEFPGQGHWYESVLSIQPSRHIIPEHTTSVLIADLFNLIKVGGRHDRWRPNRLSRAPPRKKARHTAVAEQVLNGGRQPC